MAIPFFKKIHLGAYLIKQKLLGRKRYPLVLMLEPLFRCNLACVGCGKIDYRRADPQPAPVGRRNACEAIDECGAPVVGDSRRRAADPQGHRRDRRRASSSARSSCRCAPTRCCWRRSWICSTLAVPVLLGPSRWPEGSPRQGRLAGRACSTAPCSAIKAAQGQGLHRQRQRHDLRQPLGRGHRSYLDKCNELGVDVSMSPGYAYERAPDQEHFLQRRKTKELFRKVFALGKGKNWKFLHSGLYPRLPRRQPGIPLHAVGHADAQHLRLAEALLSDSAKAMQDLQGTDGDHRLGYSTAPARYEKCASTAWRIAAMSRPPRRTPLRIRSNR